MHNDLPIKKNSHFENSADNLDIYQSYKKSPYLSTKHSTYFQVYEDLFEKYRGKKITFVEIGILNGGSLFMWRDYFGPDARIIGVEFNPLAKMWEKEGFEIHIGSQSDPIFWQEFFEKVGMVDIVLDDGGHTFEQQIVTSHYCIPKINDGGMLVVEDVHTSYLASYGYPTKYSFIEWAKKLVDSINSRSLTVKDSRLIYKKYVYSLSFFESIVSFNINRKKCFDSEQVSNGGITFNAEDFRHKDSSVGSIYSLEEKIVSSLAFIDSMPIAKSLKRIIFGVPKYLLIKTQLIKLRKYF
jgi:hypothetical protein